MGESVRLPAGARVDPAAIRHRLDRSVEALGRMVTDGMFDTVADTCGFEVELALCDPRGRARQVNDPVLAAMDRRDVVSELSQFTVELNLAPRPVRGHVLRELDDELSATLRSVSSLAQAWGARAVSIGTLPTLHAEDLTASHLSSDPRYPMLDDEMAAARRRLHPSRHHGSGAAAHHHRQHRGAVRRDEPAGAPAGAARGVRPLLQRGSGGAARAGRGGRQLAVPAREAALVRDPHRSRRAVPRRSPGGCCRSRRATAGVGRRRVGVVGGRPPRGERPTVRAAPPGAREQGPVGRAGRRGRAVVARPADSQRHGLALEPAGVRRAARPPAPAHREPGAAERSHGHRHGGQRGLLPRAGPRRGRPPAAGLRPDALRPRSRGPAQRRPRRAGSSAALAGARRAAGGPRRRSPGAGHVAPVGRRRAGRVGRRPAGPRPLPRCRRTTGGTAADRVDAGRASTVEWLEDTGQVTRVGPARDAGSVRRQRRHRGAGARLRRSTASASTAGPGASRA